MGFGILCMSSSGTYILNDLIDSKIDSLHPRKKNRAIPSGKITRNQAIILITTLLVISEIFAILLNVQFFILNSMLIASMITYSIKIKNIFLMDVFSIAINYVFRAMSGAYLIDVKISPWLIIGIFLLALLLAFGKRKNELMFLDKSLLEFRHVLKQYSQKILNYAIIITATAVILVYSIYAINGPEQIGDWRLIITIPVAFFILISYLTKLFSGKNEGKELDDLLVSDKKLLLSILSYVVLTIILIYLIPPNIFN